MNSYLRKAVTTVLLAAFSLVCVQMPVLADIVSTDQLAAEQCTQIQGDAARNFLDRAMRKPSERRAGSMLPMRCNAWII